MKHTLFPGHGLVRRKGWVFHIGTYLGGGIVVHISPDGLRFDSITEFAAGQELGIIGQPVPLHILEHRLQEARRIHTRYDPFFQNCEHLANFLQRGVRESPQMQGATLGLATALGIICTGKLSPGAGLVTALVCTWAGIQIMRPSSSALQGERVPA